MNYKPRILCACANTRFINLMQEDYPEFIFKIVPTHGTKALEELQFNRPMPDEDRYKLLQIDYPFFGIEGKVQRVASEFPNLPILAIIEKGNFRTEYHEHIGPLIKNGKVAGFLTHSSVWDYFNKVCTELINSNCKKSETLDRYMKDTKQKILAYPV